MTGKELLEEKVDDYVRDNFQKIFYEYEIEPYEYIPEDKLLEEWHYDTIEEFIESMFGFENLHSLDEVRKKVKSERDLKYNDWLYEAKEDIKKNILSDMLYEYDKNLRIVEDIIWDLINKFNDLEEDDNLKISYNIESTRSWNAGDFPSQYFVLSNDNGDEFTIRFCDGHDNGRDSSDYEVNAFDMDLEEMKYSIVNDFLGNVDWNIEITL